jgi:hypothetical protein
VSFDTDVFTSGTSGFDPDVFKIAAPGVATIPGMPQQPKPVEPTIDNTWQSVVADMLVKGRGQVEAVKSLASGIPAGLWGNIVGIATGLKPGNYGTPEGANRASAVASQSAAANTYTPRSQEGREMVSAVTEPMKNLTPLIGFPSEMANIATLAKPSVQQAKTGALNALTPKIDPEIANLAQTAEKYNIPLRPDMLGNKRIPKAVGNFLENDVPLAFSKAGKREDAFVNAIVKQIDPESNATRLTPDVYSSAMDKAGKGIGDIAARTTVDTTGLESAIKSAVREAKPYGNDTHLLVSSRARDLRNIINEGVIDGTEFKQWNSKVLQDMRNANDVTQSALGNLQEAAMSAFERSLRPEDVPSWRSYRQQYAVGKQLLPLVAKSPVGEVSPSAFMAAVTKGKDAQNRMATGNAGDIGQLAKLGTQFMREPGVGSLPERIAAYGLVGAIGREAVGTAIWPSAALYNALGPKLSKRAINLAAPPPVPGAINPIMPAATLKDQLNQNWLGDLTPDWTTSRGIKPGSEQGIDPSGLFKSLGEEPPLPQGIPSKPGSQIPIFRQSLLGDTTPDWTTSPGASQRGLLGETIDPTGLVRALGEDPLVSSRNKSRPQMPVQRGLLGMDDTAIAGGGFVDAAPGAPSRLQSRPTGLNASGESAASLEAINRFIRESKAGQSRVMVNQDGSSIIPLVGPTAVDQRARPGYIVFQKGVGKNEWTVLEQGDGVTKSMVARALAKLKSRAE